MAYHLVVAWALVCAGCYTAGRSTQARAAARREIDRIAADYWQGLLARRPMDATALGIPGFDAELGDLSAPARLLWHEQLRVLAFGIGQLDPDLLSGQTYITAAVLSDAIASVLALEVCADETWHVDQRAGLHIRLQDLGTYQPLVSAQAAADYVTRLSLASSRIDQKIDNLRRGLKTGRSAPRLVVQRVIAQLEALLAQDPMNSPWVTATERTTANIDRDALRADVLAVVTYGIWPALNRYLAFLRDAYLPRARETIGISALPDGDLCYEAKIRRLTGATLSHQDVHELGLAELAELHEQMNAVAAEQGFGSWVAYLRHLQAAPEEQPFSVGDLLAHHQALVARAAAALPKAFLMRPPIQVTVVPRAAFSAETAPAAFYQPGASDGSQPPRFVVNVHHRKSLPWFQLEALAFHETIPGHHLQVSVAQHLFGLPAFRRQRPIPAFSEGWALYAELVADEIGLYSRAATRFGMLHHQAWRAACLVADSGIHAQGWDRQRALKFFADNVGLSETPAAIEIEQIIVSPGRAVAAMIGRLEFQRLRRRAQTTLSEAFDLRRFHDAVLQNGAVPLPTLREIVSDWLAAEVDR